MDSLTSTIANAFFTTVVILVIIVCLGVFVAIFFDLKAMRLERTLGRSVVWYKRPALFNGVGTILMMSAIVLNTSIAIKHLHFNLLLYIPVFLLMAIALSMIIYGFKLAWSQKRL